jgi:UDP-glucose 4-epimerase
MHVFVTGVGGFAGARVAEDFLRRGWTVTGLTRGSLTSSPTPGERFRLIRSDAAALQSLPDKLDAVVHAAATRPFVGASVGQLMHDNVEATSKLIELAIRHEAKAFAFFSSTSVFGREHSGILTDDSPPENLEEYGRSKILCEQQLAEAASKLPSVAIRPPGIIGPGAVGNWVAATAARITAGETVTLFNPDALFNNSVHIADLADLLARLIEGGLRGHAAAIVCAEGTVTIRDVVDILMRGLQRTVEVRVVNPQRTPFTYSSDKAHRIWNWHPMTVAESLARYADEQRLFQQQARSSSG